MSETDNVGRSVASTASRAGGSGHSATGYQAARRVPVMVRGGSAHGASAYRVWGLYDTFAEAAAVVFDLRANDPTLAWAYIPDEYALSAAVPESSE